MSSKKYTIQKSPFIVPTNDGKHIEEHFGLIAGGSSQLSIARMIAPPGWSEPFQTPDFDEYTYIISGKKQFNIDGEIIILKTGESIKIEKKLEYNIPTHSTNLAIIYLYVPLLLMSIKFTEKLFNICIFRYFKTLLLYLDYLSSSL